MPRLHALELLPDDAGASALTHDWQALRDAGLPSMLDHTGSTNTPHLTVIAAPILTEADEQRAVDLLGARLPIIVRASGLVVFGSEKVTLARTVDVPDDAVRAVLDLRATTSGQFRSGWLPHLTLVRRLARADLQRAIDALATDQVEFSLSTLRRWDPDAGAVRQL